MCGTCTRPLPQNGRVQTKIRSTHIIYSDVTKCGVDTNKITDNVELA